MGTALSPIASRFSVWDKQRFSSSDEDAATELERAILFDTPQSNDDAVKMLTVLLAELAGERCDGGDLVALAAIRAFLRRASLGER